MHSHVQATSAGTNGYTYQLCACNGVKYMRRLAAPAEVCFEDFEDDAAPQPPPSAPPLPAEGFRDPAGRSSGATEASGPSKGEDEREGEAAPVSDAELCSPLLPPLGSQHSG